MYYDNNRLRSITRNLDIPLIALTLIAAIFGIIMISSAGTTSQVVIQSVSLILGVCGIVALMILDYEYLATISLYLYGVAVFLLLLVLIPGIGSMINGARSWFSIGPVSIQPAEIVKIIFIITFSNHLSKEQDNINKPSVLLKLLGHLGILCFLILLQPDFGTATVFIFMAVVMLFVAGLSWKYIAGGAIALGAFLPVAWFFLLHDYQKNRILTLFNPESDPMGAGYHVIQSKIAVGSGRFLGSGLGQGSSQVNNLLPERHTDFIFSAVCEELGLMGAIAVLLILTFIILRCIYIGMNARNDLGNYICMGASAMLIFQVFENIGMCIGLFPVTGITLPFFSYGGSSLLTTMLAIGLVLNVRYRCRFINF